MNASELVTVTVTYHPDPDLLRAQLIALPSASLKVLVDNASPANAQSALRKLAHNVPNVHLLENSHNVGLATALNQGVSRAIHLRPTARWCLLLDQDSEPELGSVAALIRAHEDLALRGEHVGSVGPKLMDAKTGLFHGFHQATKCRWRRVHPPSGSLVPVSCTNINGSGSLVSIDLFREAGGLDDSLFIDHVDTEWSFRLLSLGYTLWGIPNAVFQHRMGQDSLRYWLFGWRVWPHRSPQRHYYLFRNALWLMKRPYVPYVWKFWAAVKIALTLTIHLLIDPQRHAQFKAMTRGIREGLRTSQPTSNTP